MRDSVDIVCLKYYSFIISISAIYSQSNIIF